MAKKYTNKNDHPLRQLSELSGQLMWSEYEHANKFRRLCEIVADAKNERLLARNEVKDRMETSCVYIMIIENRIFKIGSALRGMKGRIGSYNCGKSIYRQKGTNSTSNYWVLQSLINLNVSTLVHAFYPPTKKCVIFGERIKEHFPSAKSVEGVIIRQFVSKYGKKPIGCSQR